MKKRHLIYTIIFSVFTMFVMSACGSADKVDSKIAGSWAYIHEVGTEELNISNDGTAKFEGRDYTFTDDGEYLTLKDKSGKEDKMKYVVENGNLVLYKNTVYTPEKIEPNGLVGCWYSKDTNLSFEFTDKGTFMEDAYFTGYYFTDEAAGTIKLAYEIEFQDTIVYYTLKDNVLTVSYPWTMVRTSDK